MHDGLDQAAGLRRLLVANQTRLITIAAGTHGVGRTTMTLNLADALARAGKDVLVLDENLSPDNLSDRLMLPTLRDLFDVAQGRCAVQQAVAHTHGYAVLSSARAMRALGDMAEYDQQRLEQALDEASSGADVMLVDAALLGGPAVVSSSLASGVSVLVVVDGTAAGITESYGLIKRLAVENARMQFEIVVNKVAHAQAAQTVFDNMAKVARRHLAAHLEYMGYIPTDAKLARANQLGRAVVDAFPDAPSARAFLDLSQRLLGMPSGHSERAGVSVMVQSLLRQMRYGESRPVVN